MQRVYDFLCRPLWDIKDAILFQGATFWTWRGQQMYVAILLWTANFHFEKVSRAVIKTINTLAHNTEKLHNVLKANQD